MDKLKQWIALTVVGAIVLAAAGYFLLISPKRAEAADLRAQAVAQVTANSALRTEISVLKAQAKALPAKQAQLAAVAAKIPDNPALPALIKALSLAADEANVELVSLAPSTPVAVVGPAPVGVVAGAPAAVTPAGGAAVTPVAPVGSAAGTLQQINLALTVVGGYFQVEQFLDQLESLSRSMKVRTLALVPGTAPTKTGTAVAGSPAETLSASISASVFMATGRTTVAPVAAPTVRK